jgi:hypothetical protein
MQTLARKELVFMMSGKESYAIIERFKFDCHYRYHAFNLPD